MKEYIEKLKSSPLIQRNKNRIKIPRVFLNILMLNFRCCGMLLYYMCTQEDPVDMLKNVKSFERWTPPSLGTNVSQELNAIFLEYDNFF